MQPNLHGVSPGGKKLSLLEMLSMLARFSGTSCGYRINCETKGQETLGITGIDFWKKARYKNILETKQAGMRLSQELASHPVP